MTYSVTGVTATPDIGFRCESRHTAQGARDLATAFMVAGMREVEVRDGNGNLQSVRDLDHASPHGLDEVDFLDRLAAR